MMYKKTKKDEICLWCDGIADEDSGDELETCKKRKISKREQLEKKILNNLKIFMVVSILYHCYGFGHGL